MRSHLDEVVEAVRQHPRLVSVDDYELSVQKTEALSAHYKSGVLTSQNCEQSLWLQLRVLLRRQPGHASVLLNSPHDVNYLVNSAMDSAEVSTADPWFRFPLIKVKKEAQTDGTCDPLPEPLASEQDEIPIEEGYESCVQTGVICRRIEKVEGSYTRRFRAAQFRSVLSGSLGDYQVCPPGWVGREQLFRNLCEKERWRGQARTFKKNLARFVLCRPRFLAQVLHEIGPWFCADKVQGRLSPLMDKEGHTIFSKLLSLYDNGEIEYGVNAYPFDVEGTVPRRTTLIEKGVLHNFLHNSYTAARANRPSTGNYLRDPHEASPQIAPTHLYFSSSDAVEGDLSLQMSEGISLESVDRLRLIPGNENEIFFRASGWAMHQGSRVSYFTGICGKWDLFDVLRRVVAVGKDLSFYGHCGSPSILLENVPLSEER